MSQQEETPFNENIRDQAADHRLETALRTAMRPEEPSDGFAERVEARIAAVVLDEQRPIESTAIHAIGERPSTRRAGRWALDRSNARTNLAKAAVLLMAVTLPLGWRLHRQAEVARGEAAKEQVLLAFRITGSQLRSIQERTQSINAGGVPEGASQ